MAGMWEFPTVEVEGPGLFQDELPGELGDRLEPAEDLTTMRHGITKHRITVSVRRATCSDPGSTRGALAGGSRAARARADRHGPQARGAPRRLGIGARRFDENARGRWRG